MALFEFVNFSLPPEKFKGGKADLKQSKSCLDMNELIDLLKSSDYDRYCIRAHVGYFKHLKVCCLRSVSLFLNIICYMGAEG